MTDGQTKVLIYPFTRIVDVKEVNLTTTHYDFFLLMMTDWLTVIVIGALLCNDLSYQLANKKPETKAKVKRKARTVSPSDELEAEGEKTKLRIRQNSEKEETEFQEWSVQPKAK